MSDTSDQPNATYIPSDIQKLFDNNVELRLISAKLHLDADREVAPLALPLETGKEMGRTLRLPGEGTQRRYIM